MQASATSPANTARAVHQAVVADGITVAAKAVAADGAVVVKAVADGPAAADDAAVAAETETSTSKGQISLGAGRGLSLGTGSGFTTAGSG